MAGLRMAVYSFVLRSACLGVWSNVHVPKFRRRICVCLQDFGLVPRGNIVLRGRESKVIPEAFASESRVLARHSLVHMRSSIWR
jgi:hypothetical protein